jgi:DNA replication initiation complex subunit (GINS family)
MAAEDEPFSFETIATVYREERKSKTLTKLPLNFYEDLGRYLNELKGVYVEERSKDPISPKTMMLEDEYQKAEKRKSQIYELRERKIVYLALSAANSGNPDLKLLTKNEKDAFSEIVRILSENRSLIMLEKENQTCSTTSFLSKEGAEIKETKEKEKIKTENESDKSKSENGLEIFEFDDDENENPVLLILDDIPSFETEEGSYNLKRNDAISLSKNVAKILCTHKKARVINASEKNLL